ncbi:phenylalanine--tRNA ligase subunit alpha [Candidatus Bathyarchaeota archaeon]|nr:phenylalanine--tRNA ligase subunit alpha [Candidatus Bathyarchaeota archaeon]
MVDLRGQEYKILFKLQNLEGKASATQIVASTKLSESAVMRALLALQSKNLVAITETKQTRARLTEEGKTWAKEGLPERKIINLLFDRNCRELSFSDISASVHIPHSTTIIALGWLVRKNWATVNKERNSVETELTKSPDKGIDEKLLDLLNKKGVIPVENSSKLSPALKILKKRQLVNVRTRTLRLVEITEQGRVVAEKKTTTGEVITQLTPKLLVSGQWKKKKFQKYNIEAPVAKNWPGKKHPYMIFLQEVREKLVTLGFKEMTGPSIETAFFNFDALYTPQDHPARDIFGIYLVKKPELGDLEPHRDIVAKVEKTHEDGWKTGSIGWGYKYSRQEARRLILRGHGTCLSARTLLSKNLEIPSRYFSIARCYRPEVLDKTHLSEFNQVEGIIVDEKLTLRDLLGVLEKFALEIAGADRVRFTPDYFPFTEPSVELSAYKKGYGWIELGGSGIFRPEVTLPLGVEVPVIAWGLGIDRLFMMKSGLQDIRSIFSQDLNWIRRKQVA